MFTYLFGTLLAGGKYVASRSARFTRDVHKTSVFRHTGANPGCCTMHSEEKRK